MWIFAELGLYVRGPAIGPSGEYDLDGTGMCDLDVNTNHRPSSMHGPDDVIKNHSPRRAHMELVGSDTECDSWFWRS